MKKDVIAIQLLLQDDQTEEQAAHMSVTLIQDGKFHETQTVQDLRSVISHLYKLIHDLEKGLPP